MKEKINSTLYGAIVADALGVPVEFKDRPYLEKNPVTDMTGYGTYNLPKGTWSDDSSMMLCLADSIGKLKTVDYEDIMKRFSEWLYAHHYTADGKTFDCGCTCSNAIYNYRSKGIAPTECGGKGERDNGNGSLMRIAPLPLYLVQKYGADAMDKEEALKVIHNVSRLTHGHAVSLLACDIYCSLMIEIMKGCSKEVLLKNALLKIDSYVENHPEYKPALKKYERLQQNDFKDIPEEQIKSSGYVVDTLEAALWCFLNTENYRDCVLKAVNLGSDTDTVACVAGSIAGLYYNDIPEEWIKTVRNKELIDKIIEGFSNSIL
ncbi:MAG: ADP-ribosylglycohydrolase family protein [Treponema sp.]|nr:ADP-ribosylglycohydrolase family protein [Treponema sp.]